MSMSPSAFPVDFKHRTQGAHLEFAYTDRKRAGFILGYGKLGLTMVEDNLPRGILIIHRDRRIGVQDQPATVGKLDGALFSRNGMIVTGGIRPTGWLVRATPSLLRSARRRLTPKTLSTSVQCGDCGTEKWWQFRQAPPHFLGGVLCPAI